MEVRLRSTVQWLPHMQWFFSSFSLSVTSIPLSSFLQISVTAYTYCNELGFVQSEQFASIQLRFFSIPLFSLLSLSVSTITSAFSTHGNCKNLSLSLYLSKYQFSNCISQCNAYGIREVSMNSTLLVTTQMAITLHLASHFAHLIRTIYSH